jgi:hypothetical protein
MLERSTIGSMNEAKAQNTVSLQPQGYLLVRLIGRQTFQSIEDITKACRPFIDRLKYDRKPVLGLVDFSEQQDFNTGSNRAALQALEGIPYQRAALVGSNPVYRDLAHALIAALGKDGNTKAFDTQEEAVAWLMMKDPLRG